MKMRCMMCPNENITVKHFPLYTIGSEGTYLCHDCQLLVTDFVRMMMSHHMRIKRNEVLQRKQMENKNEN